MDTTELLRSAGAGRALETLAKSYGLTPDQLDLIVGNVVPALSNRIERNTLSRGGLADVVEEAARPEHAQALADPAHVTTPAAMSAGIGALDTIFGSKDTSRAVAAQAALSSGVEQAIIQKLLPILASLLMAALSKGMQGGLGDILRKLPDLAGAGPDVSSSGSRPAPSRRSRPTDDPPAEDQPSEDDAEPAQPARPNRQSQEPGGLPGGLGDILAKIPGFPGSQPDQAPMRIPGSKPQPSGGDSGFGGGSPLPMPGDRIPGVNALLSPGPYGKLPDAIRRGGQSVDGNPLNQAVRNTLGSALGFQSKGVLSWIVQAVVMRWGWRLLQTLLGRVLPQR